MPIADPPCRRQHEHTPGYAVHVSQAAHREQSVVMQKVQADARKMGKYKDMVRQRDHLIERLNKVRNEPRCAAMAIRAP